MWESDEIHPREQLTLPIPSIEQIHDESIGYAEMVLKDQETLKDIISRHELTLRTRWHKKSRTQKEDILTNAWPSMPKKHRPDFKSHSEATYSRLTIGWPIDAFYWPQITLEDLMKPDILPIFLRARGRNPPHVFARSDIEAVSISRSQQFMAVQCMAKYVMCFKDRTTPGEYGKLVACSNEEEASQLVGQSEAMHPMDGLQTLQVQKRIYGFLVNCCEQILHDKKDLTGVSFPVQDDPGPLSSNNSNGQLSLDTIALQRPYRTPERMRLSRSLCLLFAQYRGAVDHLWTLREDPGYFEEMVHSFNGHRTELIRRPDRKEDPIFKKSGKDIRWNGPLENMVANAYSEVMMWYDLFTSTSRLQKALEQHEAATGEKSQVASNFIEEYLTNLYGLQRGYRLLSDTLRRGLHGCPGLAEFFLATPSSNGQALQIDIQPFDDSTPEGRFMSVVAPLLDETMVARFGLWKVTDAVRRLVQGEATIGRILTPWIDSNLAQMSLLGECLYQLHLYPTAPGLENLLAFRLRDQNSKYEKAFIKWEEASRTSFNSKKFTELGSPLGNRFKYPIDKHRTKEIVKTLQAAEENLDEFWEFADKHYKQHNLATFQHGQISELLAGQMMKRTPPWTEETKSQGIERDTQPDFLQSPMSPTFHDPSKEITGTLDLTSLVPKVKTKTRGPPSLVEQSTPAHEEEEAAEERGKISVPKRSMKVFRALFHSPSSRDQPGTIAWEDFLYAMISVGFSAEKLQGSAWQFTPRDEKLAIQNSIQFHEPHPTNKIPFTWARQIGRRLSRAYGWTGESFELA